MKTKKTALLAHPWLDVTSIREKRERANSLHKTHKSKIDELEAKVELKRRDIAASLSDLPENDRASLAKRAAGNFRSELKEQSKAGRLQAVREINALSQELNAARVHYMSPVQMLMREGLGSEKRSRIMEQIQDSGKAELSSLAAFASTMGDREMAAALVSRVNQMPAKERPFRPQDLANVMVGEEFREIDLAMIETERLLVEALDADRSFDTGKPSNRTTVKSALMKRNEDALKPVTTEE